MMFKKPFGQNLQKRRLRQAGNTILMLFAAIGMAGVVTYGLNNIIRGPAVTSAELSRKTIAQNNLIASSRLAIATAAKNQPNGGDCDRDGFVEALPFRAAGGAPAPTGGGLLPMNMGSSLSDPWGNQYGYCVWDPGTLSVSDNVAACGGNTANRLKGSPKDNQPAIAVISAGKDGVFQTTCAAYVDTTPADGIPDSPMITTANGADDIVLSYTYAEANGIGAGEWKIKAADPATATISKNLGVSGGGSFTGGLSATGGFRLPQSTGGDNTTGPCDASKDQQLRVNNSTTPPTLEICNAATWTTVSGGTTTSTTTTNPTCNFAPIKRVGLNDGAQRDLPFFKSGALYSVSMSGGNACTLTTQTKASPTVFSSLGSYGPNCTQMPLSNGVYSGNYFYTVNGSTNSFTVINISNPATPTYVTRIIDATKLKGSYAIDVLDSTHIVVGASTGTSVSVIDVSNPASPVIVGTVTDATNLNNVDTIKVTGKFAYAAMSGSNRVTAVNLTNPAAPTVAGTVTDGTKLNGVSQLAILNDKLFALSNYDYLPYITTIDITNPGAISIVASTNFPNEINYDNPDIKIFGKYLFRYASYNVSIFDLSNPLLPSVARTYLSTTDVPDTNGGMTVDGSYIYLGGFQGSTNKYGQFIYSMGCDPVKGTYDVSAYASEAEVAAPSLPDPLDKNLLGWWKMDEGTGTTVTDSSGNARNGTATANMKWLSGVSGMSALSFNMDTPDSVQITGLLGNPPVGTMSAWVNISRLDTTGSQIISMGDVLVLEESNAANSVNFSYWDGSTVRRIAAPLSLRGTGWHYLTATWDQTRDVFRLYIDGVSQNEYNGTSDIVWTGRGTNTFIGKHGNGSAAYDFDGAIDDVRIYSVALSPAEVARLYQRSRDTSLATRYAQVSPSNSYGRSKLSAGTYFTCAIKPNGSLWCWGNDTYGQLGNGPTVTADQANPYLVDKNTWVSVSSGYQHACGIRNDGTLWCWGDNSNAQLGIGTAGSFYPSPVQVSGGGTWTQVSAGFTHNCAIKSDATLWCWGNNGYGALGLGATATALTPTQINGGGNWNWVATTPNWSATCGIKTDGSGWCWGADGAGELGNGPTLTGNQSSPTPLAEAGPWATISPGNATTCGVKIDGRGYCWGSDGTIGALGNGPTMTADQTSPFPVMPGVPLSYIDVSQSGPCAIRTDGKLFCWGSNNNNGELGNGVFFTLKDLPYPVSGISGITAVTGGYYHKCAMNSVGSVWCWGGDYNGQLGNGTVLTAVQANPTPVKWAEPATIGIDEAGNIKGNPGYNLAVGGNSLTNGFTGLGFNGTGKSVLYQNTDNNQLLAETTLTNASTQLSFRTAADTTSTDYTTNLVAKWALDDAVGSATTTSSPGSYVGTLTNGPSWMPNYGRIAGAMYFDGVDDYLNVPNNAALRPTAITVATWIYIDGPQVPNAKAIDKIWSNSAGPTYISYALAMKQTGGGISFETGHSGTADLLYTSKDLPRNTWVYVVMTYDPAGGTANKKIYINGVLDSSKTVGNVAIAYDTTATGPLRLGQQNTTGFEGFKGALDDVRIYSAALTPAQVQQLYSYQTSLFQIPRSMGIDYSTNNFEISRNNATLTNWLDTLSSDLIVTSGGSVGVNTPGPQAKVDVNGSVKIGADYDCNQAGKVRYVATETPPWKYCNGTAWTSFPVVGSSGSSWKTDMKSVAAGSQHTCAIKTDGSLWCWGKNAYGNLGNNTTTDSNAPVAVHSNSSSTGWNDWIQVTTALTEPASTGDNTHTCGLRSNGTAWCWGLAELGRLGDGTTAPPKLRPVQVLNSAGAGYWTDWVKLSAGDAFTCGLRSNGTLWCWGGRENGRLGDGTSVGDIGTPVQVKNSTNSGVWSDWTDIESANEASCGLRSNGTVWCWGEGYDGQLGNGSTAGQNVPVQVKDSAGTGTWSDWTKISKGYSHVCGIRADGSAWCWGANWDAQIGNGVCCTTYSLPVQVQTDTGPGGWSDWRDIQAGVENTCGIRTNGTMWCWGTGIAIGTNVSTGQASRPTATHSDASSTGFTDWSSLSGGYVYNCGTRTNGSLYCWGDDWNPSRLGKGSLGDSLRPTIVP